MRPIAAAVHAAAAQPDPSELRAGEHIGPYELVREIGRGGMGFVWLANRADGAFKRSVALKLPVVTWGGRLGERMVRERDILAALEHPNIARFYDAGVDSMGRPFMAMEYVEGQAIDVYCRDRQLSMRNRLGLVLDVAKAVAYAHSKLVIHRDLKPANMLVTAEGEVRLLDFGIAKLVEGEAVENAKATQFSGRLLTPDYASPEQIRGEAIGTATDVYSLAVVAYELLTGTRPYRLKRASIAELEEAIAEADPRLASDAVGDKLRRRQLRGDLDAILNKAMKKNPADRYATVDAFAIDLQRYLAGETVLARPDRAWYRLRKLAGRHRLALGATAAILLALISATSVSLIQAHEARRQAERATAIKNFLLHVFTAGDRRAAGTKPPGEVTALELLDEGSAELLGALDTQPGVKMELIEDMADIYEIMDALDKEVALYREGVRLADQSYGPNSPEKAKFLALIAGAWSFAGRWADSEGAVTEAESAFDASGDHTSLAYAQLMKVKGNLLRRHGPRAAQDARAALQKAATLLARYPKEEGYAGALMYLAGANIALDDMGAAKKAADQAVEFARGLKGDASELAHAISLRASVEDQLGAVDEAEKDYNEASEWYAASVGKDHFFYLQNEHLRGQLLHLDGRRNEGLRLLETTTAQIRSVRPQSNTLANSLVRLSEAYLRDGSFADAHRSSSEALGLKPTQQNSTLLSRARQDHIHALIGLGQFDEALAESHEAQRSVDIDGDQSGFMALEIQSALAELALAQNDYVAAKSRIASAISASTGETRRMRHQRARLLLLSSRIAEALGELPAAAFSASAVRKIADAEDLKRDAFLRSDVMASDGEARCLQSPSADAAASLEQALAARLNIVRAGSPLTADVQMQMARCALAMGQIARAKDLAVQAERTLEAAASLGSQYTASLRLLKAGIP
jgi:serine/threonine-protein kinase